MATPSLLDTATGLENGDVASLSASYTVPGGGANKCFVVILLGRLNGGQTVTAMSLNGVTMTNRGDNGSTDSLVRVYTLFSPASGTLSGVLSANARWGLIYFTLQDVDQTTPTRAGAGIDSSLLTGNITTVSGDLVLAALWARNQVAADVGTPSGATNVLNTMTVDAAGIPHATNACSEVATGTTTAFTFTLSVDNGDVGRGTFGIPFIGAAGGATVPAVDEPWMLPMITPVPIPPETVVFS
jgi:hypothetical protein